jgi:histidinol-phosphatase (PHP family)
MWANFHTHSHYCDGVGDLKEYAEKANSEKVLSLGFSSHAPLPFPCNWSMKSEMQTAYINNIESLKADYPLLHLYKGMEVDFIPGVVSPKDVKSLLDYTIGSIHFVERFADGRYWEVDGTHLVFMDGLKSIFNNNIRDAVTRYFELTRQMVSESLPDVVGHLDKIKIQNSVGKVFEEADPWYRYEVVRTLDLIAQTKVVIEVNTRGLYQKKSPTTYPSPWILEKILQRKIPVTISSDAHHPKDLINQFSQTTAQLLAIGFREISILKDGSWQSVPLTPHGITL